MDQLFYLALTYCLIGRIVETSYSRSNMEELKKEGFRRRDPKVMDRVMHGILIGWFLGNLLEPVVSSLVLPTWLRVMLFVPFIASQVLRAWTLVFLGPRWCWQVMLPKNDEVAANYPEPTAGPFRYVPYPYHLASAIEIASLSLVGNALITAMAFSVLYWGLMTVYIELGKRRASAKQPQNFKPRIPSRGQIFVSGKLVAVRKRF